MARIRLGAAAGPGGEPEKNFQWLFHPSLMACLATSVGLVGHDSSDVFGSPMDGRVEARPGEPLEAKTRLTCGPCTTYTADVENVTPDLEAGKGASLLLLYRMVSPDGNSWDSAPVKNEDIREVIIGDDVPRNDQGCYDPEDIDDDDVYFLLIGDSTIPRDSSRFLIPSGWSSKRPQSRRDGDRPDTYARSFCLYSLYPVEAEFPRPLPEGYSEGSIVGLCESLEDYNGSTAFFGRNVDHCMRDSHGLVISNAATTLHPLYPGGDENPFNTSVVDLVTRALYSRRFFLLYTLYNEYGYLEGAAATVEYLSKPVRETVEMEDPKGRKHDVGWNGGVEEIGWFYRKDPMEVQRPPYPTLATSISISAKLVPSGNPGFKGWRVVGGIKEGGVENEEAWTDVVVEEDPQVPDRRYDVSAWDGEPIMRSDAPENN